MKIDFHILEQANKSQALRYACQLIEHAYANKQAVYIHTNSREEAEQLDKLLWIYRDDSFLPHTLFTSENAAPIQIGYEAQHLCGAKDFLVNLSSQLLPLSQAHLAEIVYANTEIQQAARERFRQYRELGCELTTHKKATVTYDDH